MPTSLKTLQASLAPPTIGNAITVFYVGSSGPTNAAQADGCCCLWTVPSGIRTVTFEAWGAGGDGGGGCCCQSTAIGATSGSYAVATVDTTAGTQFRICAALAGCTNYCQGCGNFGYPSYVVNVTTATTILCACGGSPGNMQPTWTGSGEGYTCCYGKLSPGGYSICGYVICGTGGTGFRNQFCHSDQYQIVGGGHFNSGKLSPDRCSIWACQGCAIMKGYPSFPGGPGADGNACGGGFCYGQWGAAGLVKISYS